MSERKQLKFTGLRDGITCIVYVGIASMVLSGKILQGKIDIIWHCINWIFFIAETIIFRIIV